MQKFQSQEQSVNYFELTSQLQKGYKSERLKELSAYYSNRMSYEEVSKLVTRLTGQQLLSDQSIYNIVVEKAAEVSKQIAQYVESIELVTKIPLVNEEVEIYNEKQQEVVLFYDGIQVKEQKANREALANKSEITPNPEKKHWISTDVVMLEKAAGGFEYLTAGIDKWGKERVSLEQVVKAKIKQEYAESFEPLNVVAITDGARAIRISLMIIFGTIITIILDWYHLKKKVSELMSMIANNKEEKLKHLGFILANLWQGSTEIVIEYLQIEVLAKNPLKLKELIGYLQKHQDEIINYERRQLTGKSIGSGRMEKGVDQVIGHRQKKKAMSWRPSGSKSLAILKTVELNAQWLNLWFPKQAPNAA